jgi:CelD/BcsL family acetyltransferase involved in cellulose biosynthesis
MWNLLAKNKKIKIRVISEAKELVHLENQWNAIVKKSSNNPFLLFGFVKYTMIHETKSGNPLVVIISEGKNIIGIAPLKMKTIFGGRRRVEFLQSDWSSDFIFDRKYRKTCAEYICEFILKNLKCNSARFVFSHDSPNLSFFLRHCKLRRIRLAVYPEKGRRIVPLTSTWVEFEASRPRSRRKNIRRLKRNFSKVGSWKVTCIEGNQQSEVSKRIFEVEKKSWKETWRDQRGKTDWHLPIILKASKELSEKKQDFKLRAWFLELEGKTIAYLLGIIYKKVAFLVKTSYDDQYRKFSPGIIAHSVVLQQLFEESQYEYIDFISDLKYLRDWANKCLSRVGVTIANGALSEIILVLKQKLLFVYRSSPFLNKKVKSFLYKRRYDSRFNDFLDRFR